MEVLFDSGIRSGQDILKALALGADGTLIGRAYGWGLGAMGGAGVECALELLERELSLTMALCGVSDVEDLSREHWLLQRFRREAWLRGGGDGDGAGRQLNRRSALGISERLTKTFTTAAQAKHTH